MKDRSHSGFIWFAAQDWWYHNRAHSDFQLMKEVSREQPVLVVNSLGLRTPKPGISTNPVRRIFRKLRSMSKLLRRPVPELPDFWVMTPIFLPIYGDGTLARLNARMIRFQVTTAARIAGLPKVSAIGVTIPTAWPVVSKMRRTSLVFNRSDLHSAFPEANGEWVAALEDALLSESDRVLYVSHALMEHDSKTVGHRAFFLDHGVDLERFSPGGPLASEYSNIPAPRVGFFGGLDDYVVDFELLELTAREIPEASLVLVGDATCSMDSLTSMPNVYWLGHRPYESIPSLGRGFDVALMPWLDNEWIQFANPIKLKEYLALGLPVVSTEYPEVDTYRSQIRVAKNRDEFPELVRQALADPGDSSTRYKFVEPYSWRGRADALLGLTRKLGGS